MQDITLTDPVSLGIIALGLAMGGILKGATGAGMPVITVPLIAAFYDVKLAVVIIVIPNFFVNMWQLYRYRTQGQASAITVPMVVAGMVGAVFGTVVLVTLPVDLLNLAMAGIIIIYISLRLLRPSFHITPRQARKTAWIAGGIGGILQGALGISSPAAITFLSAVRLPRPEFIFAASAFFAAMCVPQFIVQLAYGLITWQIAALGVLATFPLLASVPAGDWIGKRMSPLIFDRVILLLLAALACKQLIGVSGIF